MAWNNIAKYLEKFFVISPPGKFYQKEIIKTLNEILNINLSEDGVEYRFGIIYIKNNNQSLKNEIFLNTHRHYQILESVVFGAGYKKGFAFAGKS